MQEHKQQALAAGGDTHPASPRYINNSEEYNGTAWAEGNNLGTARGFLAGCRNSNSSARLLLVDTPPVSALSRRI